VDETEQAPFRRQREASAKLETAGDRAEQRFIMYLRLDRCARPVVVQQHHFHFADPEHTAQRRQVMLA